MKSTLIALALGDLISAALKVAASLALALLLAIAFVVASLAALLGMVVPAPAQVATNVATPVTLDSDALGAQVVALAIAQQGRPYVWGGASPETSFDCSGLVQWVYRQVGVNLPRTAQQQYNATQRVDRADLRPGDTVYFAATYPSAEVITHVGIYIGAGQMINAPTTGDVVRSLPIFSDPYWNAHYAGAGRVVR